MTWNSDKSSIVLGLRYQLSVIRVKVIDLCLESETAGRKLVLWGTSRCSSRQSAWSKCDSTARNESHWYSVTIQNVTIFDLQVKNIDFRFSSKSGASGIFLFENTTFNGQMWCFITVSGILNCNCCNIVECKTNFLCPISQNGILYGSQIDLSITF